ncbi:MAG TPA: cell division topological specificity factor MinE [Thermodesulfobacteriota bacterium]|nr:cell division topological specificity factor MinE [Thermodesulfobacteriota bacterium]
MSLFGFFRRKKSANVAKERLRMVLSYERKDLPPNFTEKIQSDLINLFQKYPQLNVNNIEINVKEGNQKDELYISIPFVSRNQH